MSTDSRDPLEPVADADDGRAARLRAEVRERVDAFGDRFDEPVRAVADISKRTMALFPVRVWRRFLARNGFLLSAGIAYQALFAIFAAIYIVFAVAGILLAGNPDAVQRIIDAIDRAIPGFIGDPGVISADAVMQVASSSASLLGWTGAIALAGFIWTAIGWMTYSRMAVRSMFGLPKDTRNYVIVKARDFVVSMVFGAVLLGGAIGSVVITSALKWIFDLVGLDASTTSAILTRIIGFAVVYAIDLVVLITMFRFLSGAAVPWRRLWGGSLLGAGALLVIQIGGSYLVGSATTNPLLATFAVFIGLLLWFRLSALVTLVAAAWVFTAAGDRNVSLRRVTPEELERERRAEEALALLVAARVDVRDARAALAKANWFQRAAAGRRVRAAEDELSRLELQQILTDDSSLSREDG